MLMPRNLPCKSLSLQITMTTTDSATSPRPGHRRLINCKLTIPRQRDTFLGNPLPSYTISLTGSELHYQVSISVDSTVNQRTKGSQGVVFAAPRDERDGAEGASQVSPVSVCPPPLHLVGISRCQVQIRLLASSQDNR